MKMGCFLGCFGYTKKRKRRKPGSKVQSTDQVARTYVPLDFEKLDASDSDTRARRKEQLNVKIKKKKVSFNLNVKTYEPLQYDEIEDYLSEGEEKTKWEYSKEEATKAMLSYPSNYRYYNYDEEESEVELDESDLEFDEIEDCDEEDYCPVPVKTENRDSLSGENESNREDGISKRRFESSVLNPVENVVQWKAIKARERVQIKNQKENVTITKSKSDPLPLNSTINLKECQSRVQEIPVNASLSNWLISSKNKLACVRQVPCGLMV